LKKLLISAVAVLAALAFAGVASAQVLLLDVPGFGSYNWLRTLKAAPANPKPILVRHTTVSAYEQTTVRPVLWRQGCAAAGQGMNGVVVLDFGKPAYNGHTYGTILFSGRFASNHRITLAMLAYGQGYAHCLPDGSPLHVTLARGTSNYHPAVPSAYAAGRKWARETTALGHYLYAENIDQHVWTAAADDAEPAWDPGFTQTYRFYQGYRSAGNGRTLYDYGSLDGGVGTIWKAWQAYYVSGGMTYAQVLPEIYTRAQAREWATLARVVQVRYHGVVRFAGVLTQHTPGCRCSLLPADAHNALVRELAAHGAGMSPVPWGGSNMGNYFD